MLIPVNIPTFRQSNSPLVGDFYLYCMEKAQLHDKIEEIVHSLGFMLIDLAVRGDSHLRIVEVFIDSEKGVNTDDCSKVSRLINETIESEGLVDSNYRLDVSSPGVDRPLKFLVQYSKHINRKFEITFKDGEESKKIIARLIRIEDDKLFFHMISNSKTGFDSELKIDFKDIIKAKVLISF